MTQPIDSKSRVWLIDGSGYIFRAYHALPPLTRQKDGMPIGAVSGFCNMLFKFLNDNKKYIEYESYFNLGGGNRHQIYPRVNYNLRPSKAYLTKW